MPNVAVSIPNAFANASGTVQTVLLDQNYTALANQANNLNQFSNYYADTGSVNSLAITVPSGLSYALSAGLAFQVKVGNTNTSTTVTLQVNSSPSAQLVLPTGASPSVGTIVAGMVLTLVYDGTYFQIQTSLTGGSSGSFSTLAVSGASTLTGNVTVGAPASGVPLTVNGVAGADGIEIVSANASTYANSELRINRAGSTINTVQLGPNLILDDTTNTGGTVLQNSGQQTEFWQYNGGWNQVMKFLTTRGVVINSPASGSVLTMNGAGSGQDQVILNSSNGTSAAADFKAVRTTSAANSVATGPNISLYDSGGAGTSLLQQSAGQTELWQYNSGWNQILRVLTTRGVEIRAPASGSALLVDGNVIAGNGIAGSYSSPQLNLNTVQYGMGVDALGNVFFKNTNNGVYDFYNSSGTLVAQLSQGQLTLAAPPANTQSLVVNGGAATPVDALGSYGGGTLTLDCSRSNVFTVTIGGNTTVSLSNMASGQTINLRTTTTGAYTVGFSPTPKWPNGTAGTATSSGTDLWVITYDGTNYYASVLNALA